MKKLIDHMYERAGMSLPSGGGDTMPSAKLKTMPVKMVAKNPSPEKMENLKQSVSKKSNMNNMRMKLKNESEVDQKYAKRDRKIKNIMQGVAQVAGTALGAAGIASIFPDKYKGK
jgi:hypothetical protein